MKTKILVEVDEADLKPFIQQYIKRINELEKEIKKLRKNAIASVSQDLKNEIKFLNERLALSYGEFESKKELNDFKKFEQKHSKLHDREHIKAYGGKAPYIIAEGTGLGTIKYVVCPICGEKKDITDIYCW